VRYLHAHSIAHLDLSLENICMDSAGHVKLIDFGLAAQHPSYAGSRRSVAADGSHPRNASHHIKLLHEQPPSALCDCTACRCSVNQLLQEDGGIRAAQQAGVSISKLKFLCRPVCSRVHKPGKLGYMSPELYAGGCWDAYAHDTFGLGVILYSMLTGRPPFTRPDGDVDVWFKVIFRSANARSLARFCFVYSPAHHASCRHAGRRASVRWPSGCLLLPCAHGLVLLFSLSSTVLRLCCSVASG
jgi:serine/threonine protein kinase